MSQGRGLVCYWYVHVTNVGVDVAGTKEHPQKQTAGNWKDPQKEKDKHLQSTKSCVPAVCFGVFASSSLVFQLFFHFPT